MTQETTYLDRNEYNYGPAPEVAEVLKNFDPNKLCFYTRIYDEGKKVFFQTFFPLYIKFRKNKSFWAMEAKIF